MSHRKTVLFFSILLLTVLCSCSMLLSENVSKESTVPILTPDESFGHQKPDPQKPDPQGPDPQEPDPQEPDPQEPDPQEPDPQEPDPQEPDESDNVYTVASLEEAESVLEEAYEGMIPKLSFSFVDKAMSLQDRYIFLQNASNQLLSRRPELKYAYKLKCTEGSDRTICEIDYMPYKTGYPNGIPQGAIEIYSLANLVEAANSHIGQEEIPIVIYNTDLVVDDMQRVLQQAGYGYIVYMLNGDATAIRATPGNYATLEQAMDQVLDIKELVHSVAESILTDDMSSEEKLHTIYSYIVEHTTYDSRYYQAPATLPQESRTAHGPLKNGTAICGGFSWAFNMLCEEAGIPCWNVTGVGAGEEHMWNCALMDGEYRYFDTTWDAGREGAERWRYFACTEEEISQNHQWGLGQKELIYMLTDTDE